MCCSVWSKYLLFRQLAFRDISAPYIAMQTFRCILFQFKIYDFDSKFSTIVDSLLEELCLLDELNSPITVATLSSLTELKERN